MNPGLNWYEDCAVGDAFTTGGIVASMGEPGSGKSYAMEVAAAVWGNHKQTIERKGSTDKSLIHKLGALGHLPGFWDEISDRPSQTRFMSVASQISRGGEGGRMRGPRRDDDDPGQRADRGRSRRRGPRRGVLRRGGRAGAGLRPVSP